MSITTTAMSPYSWRGVLDTTLCDEVYVHENWTKAEVHRTLSQFAPNTLHFKTSHQYCVHSADKNLNN